MKRKYSSTILFLSCLAAFAGDPPKEGAPLQKPGEVPKWDHADTTNGPQAFAHEQAAAQSRKAPQQLESTKAAVKTGKPVFLEVKGWVMTVNGQQIVLIPEKYWPALTNTYKTVPMSIGFPEP